MRVLSNDSIQSLQTRGYIINSSEIQDYDFNILSKLSAYNISPTPYLLLFNGLENIALKNLIRFICLNWNNIYESLDDIPIEIKNKYNIPTISVLKFFLENEKNHRVCFFVEIVHQYFFP
tara:strand:- start:1100 stop:1459 length:360 start_codon:yes stop_codon:yes gene_type:complete